MNENDNYMEPSYYTPTLLDASLHGMSPVLGEHVLPSKIPELIPVNSDDQTQFVVPATGQSVMVPSIAPTPLFKPSETSILREKVTSKCVLPKYSLTSQETTTTDISIKVDPPTRRTPFRSLSFCLLNNKQAVAAVKKHLELHYIAGSITVVGLEHIKERAIKKVNSIVMSNRNNYYTQNVLLLFRCNWQEKLYHWSEYRNWLMNMLVCIHNDLKNICQQ